MTKEIVPARMINETLFCERLLYLEWQQGEFKENHYTADGTAVHARVDDPSPLPDPGDLDRPRVSRQVYLSSDELGIAAKIDLVESENGKVSVVEYKRGRCPDVPEGAHLPERAQLAAQVMLLEVNGYSVSRAEIYFAESRRRVEIAVDDELRAAVLRAAERAREIICGPIPAPLVGNPKCEGCSLAPVCLPDEVATLTGKVGTARRLHPMRDDGAPLHVVTQGARLGVSDDRLVVRSKEGETTARIIHTSSVSIYGNAQVSTQAMRALMDAEIPLHFFSSGGWYVGRALGHESKSVDVRVAQYRTFGDSTLALRIARRVVETKIKNCRTMLRRNGDAPGALDALRDAVAHAREAESVESLLGVEGSAARAYFGAFSTMLKSEFGFQLDGRNRRPPLDPVNAMLSFGYSLLARDVANACSTVGLDPLYGFYHAPRHGRPALALDLMEEFRPIVADSAVLSAINTGMVKVEDFTRSAGSVVMSLEGKRAFIRAYEQRMNDTVKHPLMGYKISYRRLLEVQARLLTRMLLGEIDTYPNFEVM